MQGDRLPKCIMEATLSRLSMLQFSLQSDGEEDILQRGLQHLQPAAAAAARQTLSRNVLTLQNSNENFSPNV